MRITLFIIGVVFCITALILPKKNKPIHPFFKERVFEYYREGELVAWELRSYAEPPLHSLRMKGLEIPKYDIVIVKDP